MTILSPGAWSEILCEEDQPRADTFLARHCDLSRARIQKLIGEEFVQLNGKPIKSNHPLAAGDVLKIFLPAPRSTQIKAEEIPLTVLFQDKDLAVIEKPAGLVVHPAVGHSDGTLVNALLHHFGSELSAGAGIAGELRPGIVHRIDRNTSGILLVTKTDEAHQALGQQFKDHSISRRYLGLAYGKMPAEGEWSGPIGRDPKERKRMAIVEGGRKALTRYRRLSHFAGAVSLFEAELFTGRTHQIRVHFSAAAHPLVGDALYGNAVRSARQRREESQRVLHKKIPTAVPLVSALEEKGRQFLHAAHLGFTHPRSGERMQFNSELPSELAEIMKVLEPWKQ